MCAGPGVPEAMEGCPPHYLALPARRAVHSRIQLGMTRVPHRAPQRVADALWEAEGHGSCHGSRHRSIPLAQIQPSGKESTAPAKSQPRAPQGPHSRPCHRRRWSRGRTAAGTGGPHRTGRPGAPGESPAPPGLGGHPGTGPSPGWKRQVTAVSPQASNTSSRCRGEQQLMNVPG